MSELIDISVIIIFHREDLLAIPALSSMRDMVLCARREGLAVEELAVLDRPDDFTNKIVCSAGAWLDDIIYAEFSDLGLTRNKGVEAARGNFLAFLDGDDLWCADWLARAHTQALCSPGTIYHPEILYYFDESDRLAHSVTEMPLNNVKSFFMRHESSGFGFEKKNLLFNNVWTANIFAHRELHLRFPYRKLDRASGFGVEDWSWHLETVFSGIKHEVVPETVHFIRVKEHGSLGKTNVSDGVLPYMPTKFMD